MLSPCLFNLYASTSCEMLGWMNPKVESRLQEEISVTLNRQMIPLYTLRMAEWKDMCSSSPARTPKSQLAAEQPLAGDCWIPPKKIPHVQEQRRSPNKRSVQSLSLIQLFATSWTAACQTSLSITNSWSLLKLMSIELVMPSNHLILCHRLLLPSIFPSIRVFPNESVFRIMWPKYWSFSFSISPSNEYSGLISFRIDRLDLLAVQGTLKSILQHHNSKASIYAGS